jgi:hypothetical protein
MPSDISVLEARGQSSETGVLDRCEAVPKLIRKPQDF